MDTVLDLIFFFFFYFFALLSLYDTRLIDTVTIFKIAVSKFIYWVANTNATWITFSTVLEEII